MGKICDDSSPFKGGQMEGVVYRVTVDIRYFQLFEGIVTTTQQFNVTGKILSIVAAIYVPPDYGRCIRVTTVSGTSDHFIVARFGNIFYEILNISIKRADGLPDTGGDPPPTNCRCTPDSCRVDCAGVPDRFCCIDHSVTNRLLQTLQN